MTKIGGKNYAGLDGHILKLSIQQGTSGFLKLLAKLVI